jgi:hypothetical protein
MPMVSQVNIRSGSNSLHYRPAALLSASPQLAESNSRSRRFRVVPLADKVRRSKIRLFESLVGVCGRMYDRFSRSTVAQLAHQAGLDIDAAAMSALP